MRLVVLTGAGISVESGLSTFRGPDGLWDGHPIADIATAEGFKANPALVQRFYNRLRRQLDQVAPNPAHEALARLEKTLGTQMHLVTQNIDDLHRRAGSVAVTAMHGDLRKVRHVNTGEVRAWSGDVPESETMWRPHVVWFGERTIGLHSVIEKLSTADMFVAIGTSGTVYPANQFAAVARSAGAVTAQINLDPGDDSFDYTWTGPAATVVPVFVDRMLQQFAAWSDSAHCSFYSKNPTR
ncbi:NAD-dependent deacylase [Mycobacteroides chelonae]|nr:NAD-dependent deacylase [Mycobacteroides chelonae]